MRELTPASIAVLNGATTRHADLLATWLQAICDMERPSWTDPLQAARWLAWQAGVVLRAGRS